MANSIELDQIQIGADCIELVIDSDDVASQSTWSDVSLAFAIVRRATILPILLSNRKQMSSSQSDRSALFEITDCCLRLGPELCNVHLTLEDSQISQLAKNKGRSKIVGVLEMPQRPSDGWNDRGCIEAYARAVNLGSNIVKITMPAHSVEDAFAVNTFRHAVDGLHMTPALIAYSTGLKGRPSKCFNKILTSVEPAESLTDRADMRLAATAKTLTEALFATYVFEPMQFYIYGADVSYSLSPAMHNAAYQACGMRYKYEAHSSDQLHDLQSVVQGLDFGGTAITQPFKTAAVPMMNGLSPHAQTIGAVNTIVPVRELRSDGSIPEESAIIAQRSQQGPVKALYGFNTGDISP